MLVSGFIRPLQRNGNLRLYFWEDSTARKMSEWFTVVNGDESITQGDLITDCPVITWDTKTLTSKYNDLDELNKNDFFALMSLKRCDVIVMTQACDLEQQKVSKIILCPATLLSEFKESWTSTMLMQDQNPTNRAWENFLKKVNEGSQWNFSIIDESVDPVLTSEHRIVDFHEIFTLPIDALREIASRKEKRLRLMPPYREHLSQAFARFFMRVGLPSPLKIPT